MERGLQTKTLIAHTVMMLSRVGFSSLGQSYWQKAFKTREENQFLDQQFVELTMPYVKIFIIALLPIGLILDLLTWRRRKFGNLIVYYEVLSNLVQAFVPFDYGNFELLVILQTYLMVYLICVCKTGQSVIACIVGITLHEFCIAPLMYNYEGGMWSIGRLLSIL